MDCEGNEWVQLAQNRDHWPAVAKNTMNIQTSTKTGFDKQFFEALRYKPKDREFDSRWCHWNFSLT
jgi:hypothetical protein